MAYKIVASQCTSCSACEPECPNVAIPEKGGTFIIDPAKCTECLGHFDVAAMRRGVPGRRHLRDRQFGPARSALHEERRWI